MTSFVFPGQGSQYPGMSIDFYDEFKIAQNIFEAVSDSTKIDIKSIITNNKGNLLNQTKYTQLSIFTASISIFKVLESEIGLKPMKISCMLGHSLGEYSAITAANYLSIQECAILLKKRGELMQNAFEPNLSGMVAIIGLNCASVEKIISKNNLNIEIANDNSPMQIVVSGKKSDLNFCQNIFLESGAKRYLPLNVSAAFHSIIMKDAEMQMKEAISQSLFLNSKIPIISNYNSNISDNKKIIIDNLSSQMSKRVRWVESIRTLETTNEKNIIEIGPGKVLSNLIKRISSNFNIINVDNISDLKKIKNEI